MADSKGPIGKPVEAGKGLPAIVSSVLKDMKKMKNEMEAEAINHGPKRSSRRSFAMQDRLRRSRATSVLTSSAVSALAAMLELDEYEIPDGDEEENIKTEFQLDVTALDRYNEDIRKLRKQLIAECRAFPPATEPDAATYFRLKGLVRCLCRSAFFGTKKAQVLAESTVILIIWLLNKKNLNRAFKVHLLQSFAEMIWISEELKMALHKCQGTKVLIKLLVTGVTQRSDQARWATYTLAMACIGCKEIIETVQGFTLLEEVVGEVAFNAYWANWPANFGQILQGILYGPHAVIPMEDAFEFL